MSATLNFYPSGEECNPKKVLYHVTVFAKPTDHVVTTRGQMSYKEWLEESEMPRFQRSGWPVALVSNSKQEICLVHLRVNALR